MIDFIIFFEHQTRELENAVLLAEYLKKKGYKVVILRVNSFKMLYKRAKTIIVPYSYSNEDVFSFVSFPFYSPKKLINLQYEQVFTEKDEKSGAFIPKDVAKECQTVVWGKHVFDSLLCNGFPNNRLNKIGNIAIDFDSPKFSKYFKTKKDISIEYNLPLNKKWHLFISSFSFINLTESHKNNMKRFMDDIDDRIELSVDSQMGILKWFAKYLDENDDTCIIYRPHPAEVVNEYVKELELKYSNFYVIGDYSIRQWIIISDSISNWYSTSIADIYYAKKPCFILRPLSIPSDMDMLLLTNSKCLTTFDEFVLYMKSMSDSIFPVSDKVIREYYYNTFDGDCHVTLGDFCERVLLGDQYAFDYKGALPFTKLYYFKRYVWLLLMLIASRVDLSNVFPEKNKVELYYMYYESRCLSSRIKKIKRRIEKVLNDE